MKESITIIAILFCSVSYGQTDTIVNEQHLPLPSKLLAIGSSSQPEVRMHIATNNSVRIVGKTLELKFDDMDAFVMAIVKLLEASNIPFTLTKKPK